MNKTRGSAIWFILTATLIAINIRLSESSRHRRTRPNPARYGTCARSYRRWSTWTNEPPQTRDDLYNMSLSVDSKIIHQFNVSDCLQAVNIAGQSSRDGIIQDPGYGTHVSGFHNWDLPMKANSFIFDVQRISGYIQRIFEINWLYKNHSDATRPANLLQLPSSANNTYGEHAFAKTM